MTLAAWLMQYGLSAPTAALWATLGVVAIAVLLGVGFVAWKEGWSPRSHCPPSAPPRGATRHNPGQPREGVAVVLRSETEK